METGHFLFLVISRVLHRLRHFLFERLYNVTFTLMTKENRCTSNCTAQSDHFENFLFSFFSNSISLKEVAKTFQKLLTHLIKAQRRCWQEKYVEIVKNVIFLKW